MSVYDSDSRRVFVFGIRIFFGIWLLYAGLFKWVSIGAGPFVDIIVAEFSKTWAPHGLIVVLAWLILFAEPLLAIWILSGIKQRIAWSLTALFMFMLVAGQSILMKPDVIANWEYLVLTLACAALSPPAKPLE